MIICELKWLQNYIIWYQAHQMTLISQKKNQMISMIFFDLFWLNFIDFDQKWPFMIFLDFFKKKIKNWLLLIIFDFFWLLKKNDFFLYYFTFSSTFVLKINFFNDFRSCILMTISHQYCTMTMNLRSIFSYIFSALCSKELVFFKLRTEIAWIIETLHKNRQKRF